MSWWSYRPYVPVAERRAKAIRKMGKLAKKGQKFSPVKIIGRKIATTFWGKAWCNNLESYSDFSNRLPRGRTYVRNGSVLDLQIEAGRVTSVVCGSEIYRIAIKIKPLNGPAWKAIRTKCGQQIGSLVELLQGKLSKDVMAIVTEPRSGLFPAPHEIEMSCSCPDWAGMCKHLAAALYGVGNRLDGQPELLFTLRQVDQMELITQAGSLIITPAPSKRKSIAAADLADVFGIEFDESLAPERAETPAKSVHKGEPISATRKTASRDALARSHTAKQSRQRAPQELRKNLDTSPQLPNE
jgi:uncharacterized Zn finger protein